MSDDVLGAWDAQTEARPRRAAAVTPSSHGEAEHQRHPSMMQFLESRGIGEEAANAFGVYVFNHRFQAYPQSDALPAIIFPYRFGGRLVNRAYRHPKGRAIEYEGAALPTLFNIDAVDANDPQEVVWAQSEQDVLALHQAGYPQSVSLPQIPGPAPRLDPSDPEPEDRRFLPLETHHEVLGKAAKLILACGSTDAGVEMREELARRLGRHRCWLVTWPKDCATASDTLQKHGTEALQQAIVAAEPYPIEGMHRVTEDVLLALRRRKRPAVMDTGVGVLNRVLRLPTEGRLIVVLGIPNHGKTPFVRHLACHTMQKHSRRWAVFSPEMRPWERFAASCAEWLTGKRFYPPRDEADMFAAEDTMSDDDLTRAAQWLKPRLVMLVNDAERQQPTLDWLFDLAKVAVMRDGVTDLWVDPWNELAHQRPATQREDEYIGQSLQRFLAFGNRHGCNVWINVHPVTLRLKPGDKIQAPGPYDIAGGAMWFNKADIMLTVFRPADNPLTQIIVRKAKELEWGRRSDDVEIAFNTMNGRYSTPVG